jgi:hypothetical protein
MAMVHEDRGREEIAACSEETDDAIRGLITRRSFLGSAGVTVAGASALGPWLSRARASSAGAYETVGAMMRYVADAPVFESALRQIDQVWTFALSNPKAVITCSMPAKGPLEVEFGPNHSSADMTISMTTADAGRYLLGELDPSRVSIAGSSDTFTRTIPRMRDVVAPAYQRLLQTGKDPFAGPPQDATPPDYPYRKGEPLEPWELEAASENAARAID